MYKLLIKYFELFYDYMNNKIGGGKSYAPKETKW
jgi:hypothetical protein